MINHMKYRKLNHSASWQSFNRKLIFYSFSLMTCSLSAFFEIYFHLLTIFMDFDKNAILEAFQSSLLFQS